MSNLASQLIAEEEGPRSRVVYLDSLGYETIGRGCLVDARMKGAGLCDAALDAQEAHDISNAAQIASSFPFFDDMNDVRQAALTSMTFQLGRAPLGWKNFMAALTAKDYESAAAAGLDSLWAKSQTPKRATREMEMLRTGLWVAHT